MKPKKFNSNDGFTLIESMLSLMIFSLFLLIAWETQHRIFNQISDVFKQSELALQRVQILETTLAYTSLKQVCGICSLSLQEV